MRLAYLRRAPRRSVFAKLRKGLGDATLVGTVALIAAAVLTIVGAIVTVEAWGQWVQTIAAGRSAVAFDVGEQFVTDLKTSLLTSIMGAQLEVALWLNDINSGED